MIKAMSRHHDFVDNVGDNATIHTACKPSAEL
jgi:hypothetical protein